MTTLCPLPVCFLDQPNDIENIRRDLANLCSSFLNGKLSEGVFVGELLKLRRDTSLSVMQISVLLKRAETTVQKHFCQLWRECKSSCQFSPTTGTGRVLQDELSYWKPLCRSLSQKSYTAPNKTWSIVLDQLSSKSHKDPALSLCCSQKRLEQPRMVAIAGDQPPSRHWTPEVGSRFREMESGMWLGTSFSGMAPEWKHSIDRKSLQEKELPASMRWASQKTCSTWNPTQAKHLQSMETALWMGMDSNPVPSWHSEKTSRVEAKSKLVTQEQVPLEIPPAILSRSSSAVRRQKTLDIVLGHMNRFGRH